MTHRQAPVPGARAAATQPRARRMSGLLNRASAWSEFGSAFRVPAPRHDPSVLLRLARLGGDAPRPDAAGAAHGPRPTGHFPHHQFGHIRHVFQRLNIRGFQAFYKLSVKDTKQRLNHYGIRFGTPLHPSLGDSSTDIHRVHIQRFEGSWRRCVADEDDCGAVEYRFPRPSVAPSPSMRSWTSTATSKNCTISTA